MANYGSVQQGNLTGYRTEQILGEMYNDTRTQVGKTDILYIVDKNGIIRLVASDDESQRSFVGRSISFRDYVNQTKTTLEPVFSNGLRSLDGTYSIVITYPIINRETGQYGGLVAAALPTVDFKRFGNVYSGNTPDFYQKFRKCKTTLRIALKYSCLHWIILGA